MKNLKGILLKNRYLISLGIMLSTAVLINFKPLDSYYPSIKTKPCLFFDLGDVILHVSKSTAFKTIGLRSCLNYIASHRAIPGKNVIQNRMFEYMDFVTGQPRSTATTDNNIAMPAIMYDWTSGKISGTQMQNVLNPNVHDSNFFKSSAEKKIITKAIDLMRPDKIVKIQKTDKDMVKLLQQYCREIPGNVFILSNWDKESIPALKSAFPEVFAFIPESNLIFSGEVGDAKPNASIFNYACSRHNIHPSNCVLIDDQATNTRSAVKCGWQAITHKNHKSTNLQLAQIIKNHNPIATYA